MVQIKAKKMRY